MNRAAAILRVDRGTWSQFGATASLASAGLVAIGAFGVFAWDRFGLLALFAPRPTLRLLLIGFYGWWGLAAAAWLVGRLALDSPANFGDVVRLYGLAHLPLFSIALAMQLFAVLLQILGPGLVAAAFGLGVWMPAQLVAASRELFGVDTREAVALTAGPYLLWLATVGTTLLRQVGHLL